MRERKRGQDLMPQTSVHQTEDRLKTAGTFYLLLCNLQICTSLTLVQFHFANRFLCLFAPLLICHLSLSKVIARRINKFTATAAGSVRFPPCLSSVTREKNNSISCIIYPLYFLFVLCRIMTMRGRNCWQPEVSAPKLIEYFFLSYCGFRSSAQASAAAMVKLSKHFFFIDLQLL